MDYIILDLEWNQPVSKNSYPYLRIGDRFSNEIIEIGAAKVNDRLQIVDTFKVVIKPKYYKKLNSNVMKITHLKQEIITGGIGFDVAIAQFQDWCGKDAMLFSWGRDDIYVMKQNLEFYEIDSSWIQSWYNLQLMFSKEVFGNSNQRSLSFAMEHFAIPQEDARPFHDAENDAYYTAKIFLKLDIRAALDNYDTISSFASLCHEEMGGGLGPFRTKGEALSNKEVTTLLCPQCKTPLTTSVDWFANNDKYVSLASCKAHGTFLGRIKFIRQSDGLLRVRRSVQKAQQEQLAQIKQKSEMKKEKAKAYRRTRMKKLKRQKSTPEA